MKDYDETEFKLVHRDTGRGLLIVSALAFALSIFALFKSLSIDSFAPNAVADKEWWNGISTASGATSGTTFLVGSVLRAIWFIPGDDVKAIRKLFKRG